MLTVAIQAGGRSHRMGQDKGLVKLAGRPLIEHVLSRLRGVGDDTLITTNDPAAYAYLGIRLVADPEPGAGALSGLWTALDAAYGGQALVVACDMPFIRRPLVEYLLSSESRADVLVPRWRGRLQPFLCIYTRNCLPAIEKSLMKGKQSMTSFYPLVEVHVVEMTDLARLDPEGLSFFNLNSPEDLGEAERLLADEEDL